MREVIKRIRVGANLAESDVAILDESFKRLQELQSYKDTTKGLWATDRPDLVQDPKKLLFQL